LFNGLLYFRDEDIKIFVTLRGSRHVYNFLNSVDLNFEFRDLCSKSSAAFGKFFISNRHPLVSSKKIR